MDDHPKPNRREFCAQAASFIAIGALFESCGGSPTSPSGNVPQLSTVAGTVANNAVNVAVDSGSPLASNGSAALVTSSAGSFLVARTGDASFNAMTSVCTHEACTVSGYQSGTFTCPCHGSQFSSSGTVVRGPATVALRKFNTAFANNVLTISLT